MRTSWNLGLLYKNDKDPQIEKDLLAIERACSEFEKKYKKEDFTRNPESLAKALADQEELQKKFMGSKPWWYFALKKDLNSSDNKSVAMATKYEQRLANASNKVKFFSIKIGKIEKAQQMVLLKEKSLLPYSYKLKKIFDASKFKLTEQEEQLDSLLSQTSYSMWNDGQAKLLNEQTVNLKGKKIPLSEASNKLADLNKKDRKDLHRQIIESLKSVSHFAEAELNAIYNYKKIMDERRGYQHPYSATVLGYENEEKTVDTLVSLVTKNFKISQRFYKLHTKLLKEKKITYADRGVKIGEIKKKFPFSESVAIVRTALARVDEKYAEIFDAFVKNGQLDVYPRKGKRSGAYCWGMGMLPTFLLLNHVDTVDSTETLGHEMGHAIHTEMSKNQPYRYQKYSISTAEVASTFFEQITTEEIEKRLSDKEKIIMLHNKIMGDITTIFRQIACFNFELELHNKIRKEGQISKDSMADLMVKNMKAYLGSSVDMDHDDGYVFVSWPHIRRFFYVYSYAFGQLVSRALFQKWKQDPNYAKKIDQFLKAGKSMSPEDIFKSIGIDTSKPEFFEAGLKSIEEDIKRLEKLTK
jgi:oligoendopeptidase F